MVADKHLYDVITIVQCGKVDGLERGNIETIGLSCEYSMGNYNDEGILPALMIVFEGLLCKRTVLRAAQLYAPELTAQLPYFKAQGQTPRNVKSAIEGQDTWLISK